jgi:hypothetical protein
MRMLRFAKVLVWSHTCATLAPLLTIGRTAPKGGNWSCFGSQSQSVFIRRTTVKPGCGFTRADADRTCQLFDLQRRKKEEVLLITLVLSLELQ